VSKAVLPQVEKVYVFPVITSTVYEVPPLTFETVCVPGQGGVALSENVLSLGHCAKVYVIKIIERNKRRVFIFDGFNLSWLSRIC
jgi:hypothetical protein